MTLKFQAQLKFTFYAAVNHNYEDKHWTPENEIKKNGLKSTNHNPQTWSFDHFSESVVVPKMWYLRK